MAEHVDSDLALRRAVPADRSAIIELLAASLGRDRDPRYEALYAWKHEENVFGPSPVWVAVDGSRIAGIRVLMRWEFRRGERILHAVRAVDTATHPDYQGRGIFTRLTLHAIGELRAEGVDFVFNTPNDQSRPGYLKMGWQVVGRLPTFVRPTKVRSLPTVAKSRVPAERWSTESTAGVAAASALEDREAIASLLEQLTAAPGLETNRSPEFLRWRYGTPLLGYRVIAAPGGIAEGMAIFRVRERGDAKEVALCELLAPGRRTAARLTRAVAKAADADYVLRLGSGSVEPGGMVRLGRQGPLLTWRAVSRGVMPPRWDVTLGDIELF